MEEYKDELLRKYLDGELTPEKEQEVLHIIADDEEMRSMLRFEQQLSVASRKVSDFSSFEVPLGFTDQVMSAIEAEETVREESNVFDKLTEWLQVLVQPREIQLRPVYAMAMLLAVIVLVGIPYNADRSVDEPVASNNIESTTVENVSDNGEQVWTRFVYIDKEAESVSVAGDFSDWNPVELTRQNLNGEQVWTGLVPMNRGEHRYMFIKNGEQWVTDPLAPVQQDDGFGNKNAVIYL